MRPLALLISLKNPISFEIPLLTTALKTYPARFFPLYRQYLKELPPSLSKILEAPRADALPVEAVEAVEAAVDRESGLPLETLREEGSPSYRSCTRKAVLSLQKL